MGSVRGEEFPLILYDRFCDRLLREPLDLGHRTKGNEQICRLVSLLRRGSQNGAIGFEKDALERKLPNELLFLLRTNDRGWDGKEVTRLHALKCHGGPAVEGVHQNGAGVPLIQELDRLATRRSGMNIEGQSELDAEIDEATEDLSLNLAILLILDLPMIETYFTDGHEVRFCVA